MQKVMVAFDPDLATAIDAANNLRRLVASNIEQHGFDRKENFDHTALYYEIYGSVDNTVPFAMSYNSRWRKEHVNGQRAAESLT
jgi:hypothetical protein